MKYYPLESMDLNEAKKLQFKIVDAITKVFSGSEILSLGDLGVVPGLNKPRFTQKVEQVIKEIFNTEKAMLVRGSGTGAIRVGLQSMIKPGGVLLVHDAPVYPTTKVTIDSMGLQLVKANFNDLNKIEEIIESKSLDCVLIQHTRQKPDDSYNLKDVIECIKAKKPKLLILVDDNYAIFKVRYSGVEVGAELGAFSSFKLLGPEGIGVLVGKKTLIEGIVEKNYSGGSQVQGHEALEVLRGFVYAPVSLAVQNEVIEEVKSRLNRGEIEGVLKAFIVNGQSKVVLVEFKSQIAKKVLIEAEKLGAAPNPVGAESKYEIAPMFYRVSGTFTAYDHSLEDRMIRINPMRSGADTVDRKSVV